MRNHKLKVLSLSLLLLSGCSNTGSGGGVATNDEAGTVLENPVRLGQLGVLPASNSSSASYLLQLTNYSKDKYTLDSVRAIDLDTGKDSKLVSIASQACSTVVANGSCSIQLTPHTAQSADVKLEVKLKDKKGEIKTLIQLIRISGDLSANNGGIVMLNDVGRIVTEDGNYSLSIPVVLGESYDNIKASNGSLICNTAGYEKGSSCTYQLSGKVAGDSAVVSTRLEGFKAGKTVTIQEANTKVEVAKGAHLLLSHGTKIDHPATSAEITVFNSGNVDAKDVAASVEAASGLKIETASASACQATLAANDSCKVKVSVNSSTNGQAPVKVAYTDGSNNHTAVTNVRYKVANAAVGVSLTVTSNNLLNAIVRGKTREAIIEVNNTGNRALTGINYYFAPAGDSKLKIEKAATDSCELGGSATLAAGAKCNLSVKYTPTAPETSKSINFVLNGRYTDQHGQNHSLLSSTGLTYSAQEASAANLTLTKTSGNEILSIFNDNNSNESATWELRNTLAADENLPASNVNVTLNPTTIDGLKVAPVDAKTCPVGSATLAGNSACEYKVTYGPTRVEQALTNVNLVAGYTLDSKSFSSNGQFKVSTTDPEPKIQVDIAMKPSGSATVSGTGSQIDPWIFAAYSNKTVNLEYTFTNIGKVAAKQFNIDTGSLPNGVAVKANDCPTGTDTTTFESGGASCKVTVTIPDPELFDIPNLVNGSLNSATLKLDLPYSYISGSSIGYRQADTKYINFTRLWAQVSHTILRASSLEDAYVFDVKTTIGGSESDPSVYPITITPTLAHPIPGVNFTPCTIELTKNQCINKISLPKNMFVPGPDILVTFRTSGQGINKKDEIISDHLVRISDPPKHPLRVSLTRPIYVGDDDAVGYGIFKGKRLAVAEYEYPFELAITEPVPGTRNNLSNIKLSKASVVPNGITVQLLTNSCSRDLSETPIKTCYIKGSLHYANLAPGQNHREYKNESASIILEAVYKGEEVLTTEPVQLPLDSIVVEQRNILIPKNGKVSITNLGTTPKTAFILPEGTNERGIVAGPQVAGEEEANTWFIDSAQTNQAVVELVLPIAKHRATEQQAVFGLVVYRTADATDPNLATELRNANAPDAARKGATFNVSADLESLRKYHPYKLTILNFGSRDILPDGEDAGDYFNYTALLERGWYDGHFYIYARSYTADRSFTENAYRVDWSWLW